jgi:predicted nucleic acid-binding protein
VIYLDTSALTKLLVAQPETPELRAWLTAQSGQGEYAATSALGRVELMRVVAVSELSLASNRHTALPRFGERGVIVERC